MVAAGAATAPAPVLIHLPSLSPLFVHALASFSLVPGLDMPTLPLTVLPVHVCLPPSSSPPGSHAPAYVTLAPSLHMPTSFLQCLFMYTCTPSLQPLVHACWLFHQPAESVCTMSCMVVSLALATWLHLFGFCLCSFVFMLVHACSCFDGFIFRLPSLTFVSVSDMVSTNYLMKGLTFISWIINLYK